MIAESGVQCSPEMTAQHQWQLQLAPFGDADATAAEFQWSRVLSPAAEGSGGRARNDMPLWSTLVVSHPVSDSRGDVSAGGANETRTRDPLLAKQVLFQLSYSPKKPQVTRLIRDLSTHGQLEQSASSAAWTR
jgi:hypothetical protein